MDTLTHALFGITIGIVSCTAPGLKEHPEVIFPITIASSLIPDIDVVTKPFKNENYLRAHRGITHTYPALFVLAFVAPLLTLIYSSEIDFFILYLISCISILSHQFLDILNPYGTLMIPRRGLTSVGTIYTFDPCFLSFLILAILFYSVPLIAIIFMSFSIIYVLIRQAAQMSIKKRYKRLYPDSYNIYVLSRLNPLSWNIIIENENDYVVAKFEPTDTIDLEIVPKVNIDDHTLELIKNTKIYRSFCRLAYCYNIEIIDEEDSRIIVLYDLKYKKKGTYYFRAIFRIKDDKIINSYVGFILSDDGFEKKLNSHKTN